MRAATTLSERIHAAFMQNEVQEGDGSDFAVPDALTPRKTLTFETTTGPYLRLIVSGLKEHEANEIRDLLRSRGWVD
jgi:hypothetical protein